MESDRNVLGLFRSGRARLIIGVALAATVVGALLSGAAFNDGRFGLEQPKSTTSPRGPEYYATPLPIVDRQALSLHVQGTQLVTHSGHAVILRGVNVDGSDFLCAEGQGIFHGPTDQASILALLSWHINLVRIPLNEQCWLGNPGIQARFSGQAYQSAVTAYVQALTENGIYVILDLHKAAPGTQVNAHTFEPMPDADHSVTFWQQIASMFKDDGMVLFDLYNEPHDVSWTCLRDGGICDGVPYRTVGMQTLVQVVRMAGAANVLLIPGISWAEDIRSWLYYKPVDPLHNLVASWHFYAASNVTCLTVACYAQIAGTVATGAPLILDEFGADVNGKNCDPQLLVRIGALLDWLDQHNDGYAAFTWDVLPGAQACGSLALITDYAGTPHAPNGTQYKAHLLMITSGEAKPTQTP